MSATNGTFYSEKSMNGIITLDDGMGCVIEGGDMTIDEITCDSLFCDNIQTKSNLDDAYLYTNTTGNIFIGTGAILNTNHIKCNDIQGELQTDSATLYTETTTGNIQIATGQDAGAILKLGNQNNTNLIGGISIVNQAIEPDFLTQNMYIGENLTTGNLIIANTTADVKLCGFTIQNQDINAVDPTDTMGFGFNMTPSAYLTIGNSTNNNMIGNVHIVGQTLTAEYPSQPVNIFNDLLTSTLSLCGGMTTGIINMATAMTGGFVNIGTFMTVGAVNIGSATSNVLLNNSFMFSGNSIITQSVSTALNLFNNIQNATVSMLNGMTSGTLNLCNNIIAGTVNIASQSTSSFINIGSTTATIALGNWGFFSNTLTTTQPNSTINLLNNLGAGILNIATTASGTLNIGNAMTLGTINIGSGNASGTLNFGSAMASGNVNVGSSATTNRVGNFNFIQNAITTGSTSLATYLFNNLLSAQCYICNAMTNGSIYIGTVMNSSGNIYIGSQTSTNTIGNFILTGDNKIDGNSSFGTFGLLANVINGVVKLGQGITIGTIRIGEALTSGNIILGNETATGQVRANGFRITQNDILCKNNTANYGIFNNVDTGSLYVGTAITTGGLNLGPSQAQSGNIYIKKPIVADYTVLSTPLNANAMGYTIFGTGTINQSTGAETTIRTLTLTTGVWILTGNVFFNSGVGWASLSISGANNVHSFFSGSVVSSVGSGNCANVTKIVTVPSTSIPQYLVVNSNGVYPLINVAFQATRIA